MVVLTLSKLLIRDGPLFFGGGEGNKNPEKSRLQEQKAKKNCRRHKEEKKDSLMTIYSQPFIS